MAIIPLKVPIVCGSMTRDRLKFALYVDNFGVKYYSMDDAQHLILSLRKSYDITLDWAGTNYYGVKLQWHYKNGYVDMNMRGYVTKALRKYNHPPSK